VTTTRQDVHETKSDRVAICPPDEAARPFDDCVSDPVPGLASVLDQKQSALIVAPTAALRAWIRAQPPDGLMFGEAAMFVRNRGGPRE